VILSPFAKPDIGGFLIRNRSFIFVEPSVKLFSTRPVGKRPDLGGPAFKVLREGLLHHLKTETTSSQPTDWRFRWLCNFEHRIVSHAWTIAGGFA
jgi:hypothetical protein